jgi:hypothetical protein
VTRALAWTRLAAANAMERAALAVLPPPCVFTREEFVELAGEVYDRMEASLDQEAALAELQEKESQP